MTKGNNTAHQKHPGGDLPLLGGWDTKANVEAKINADTALLAIKDYYKLKYSTVTDFLTFRQQWKNSHFAVSKGNNIKDSLAARGLIGAQEIKATPESGIMMDLQRFNVWYLKGDISNGMITNGTLP